MPLRARQVHRGWGYPGNNPVNLIDPYGLGLREWLERAANWVSGGWYGTMKTAGNLQPVPAQIEGCYHDGKLAAALRNKDFGRGYGAETGVNWTPGEDAADERNSRAGGTFLQNVDDVVEVI